VSIGCAWSTFAEALEGTSTRLQQHQLMTPSHNLHQLMTPSHNLPRTFLYSEEKGGGFGSGET